MMPYSIKLIRHNKIQGSYNYLFHVNVVAKNRKEI